MKKLKEKICLIIPCYNEENRIDFKKFIEFDSNCCFIFVNDGSKDNTAKVIEENIRNNDNMYILDLKINMGKAEAVRQGMLYFKTLPIFEETEWVGFWDADLATPLDEVYNFFAYVKTFNYSVDSIWGSRIYKLGSKIKRSAKRHYLGRVFATFVGVLLKVDSYDSQCGAKLFKKELIDGVFSEKFISRWIFDVEMLLRLKNHKLVECPLMRWEDIAGSKIKVIPVGIKTLFEILKIKKQYKI